MYSWRFDLSTATVSAPPKPSVPRTHPGPAGGRRTDEPDRHRHTRAHADADPYSHTDAHTRARIERGLAASPRAEAEPYTAAAADDRAGDALRRHCDRLPDTAA